MKKVLFIFLLVSVFSVAVACGNGGGNEDKASDTKIIEPDMVLTVEDVRNVGAKANKEYDVADLPGALSAWRAIFDKKDFELRFYEDQSSAINLGTEWVESTTGEDAAIKGDGVMWDEGKKDRRRCSRGAETPHSGCSYSARYFDYMIVGNMILMCEGYTSDESIGNCKQLLDAIGVPHSH